MTKFQPNIAYQVAINIKTNTTVIPKRNPESKYFAFKSFFKRKEAKVFLFFKKKTIKLESEKRVKEESERRK